MSETKGTFVRIQVPPATSSTAVALKTSRKRPRYFEIFLKGTGDTGWDKKISAGVDH
jgi:hypothetical protein